VKTYHPAALLYFKYSLNSQHSRFKLGWYKTF